MQTKLLINGQLVAGAGKVEDVLNPATGKVLAKVPEASRAQIDAAVKAADAAFDGWARTAPKDRAALLLEARRSHRGRRAGVREARIAELRQAAAAALNDEIPAIADVFRFFAGACRTMTGAVAGEYLAGLHEHDPPRSRGRGRLDRAVELSADDGGVEARSGARGRQYRGAQALRADPADGAEARRHCWPSCSRPASSTSSAAAVTVSARPLAASEGPHDLADRRRRDRQQDPPQAAARHQAHASGTRRQGARHRLRRCRPRQRVSRACAPSATTTPARIAPRPAASTRAPRIYDRLVADLSAAVSTHQDWACRRRRTSKWVR